jgi:hypothetical protein
MIESVFAFFEMWENLQIACRQIADVRQDFRTIREKTSAAIA